MYGEPFTVVDIDYVRDHHHDDDDEEDDDHEH